MGDWLWGEILGRANLHLTHWFFFFFFFFFFLQFVLLALWYEKIASIFSVKTIKAYNSIIGC